MSTIWAHGHGGAEWGTTRSASIRWAGCLEQLQYMLSVCMWKGWNFKFLVQEKAGFCDDDVKKKKLERVNLGGVASTTKLLLQHQEKKKYRPTKAKEKGGGGGLGEGGTGVGHGAKGG